GWACASPTNGSGPGRSLDRGVRRDNLEIRPVGLDGSCPVTVLAHLVLVDEANLVGPRSRWDAEEAGPLVRKGSRLAGRAGDAAGLAVVDGRHRRRAGAHREAVAGPDVQHDRGIGKE